MAGNPVLDEIDQLSPQAKAALAAAHQSMSAQLAAPGNPAIAAAKASAAAPPPAEPAAPNPIAKPLGPGLNAMSENLGLPSLPGSSGPSGFAFSRTGKVAPLGNTPVPQLGTTAGDTLERQRLMATGPGVNQIQNGKLRGLAKVGDVIGGLVAPGLMAAIPGTTAHHNVLLSRSAGNLTADLANDEKQAQTANQNADVPLKEAQAREANARAQALEEPLDKTMDWAVDTNFTGPKGEPVLFNKNTGEFKVGDQVLGMKRAEKEPPPGTKTVQLEVGGKPHQVLVDERTGETVRDLGESGEKPPTVNVGGLSSSDEKELARLARPYETALTAGQGKMDRIDQTLHSVDAGYVGQGLAIPELLTSLVSGTGTGVRITQPELNAITAARGIKGNAEAWFNTMAGKGKLTDTDKQQIRSVLNDAKQRLQQKIDIHNGALDSINGAANRSGAAQADKTARQQLNDLEKYGHYAGEKVTVGGKEVVIKKIDPDGTFEY